MACWSDFGPYKCLEDKNMQSIIKSMASLEVNHYDLIANLQTFDFQVNHVIKNKSILGTVFVILHFIKSLNCHLAP